LCRFGAAFVTDFEAAQAKYDRMISLVGMPFNLTEKASEARVAMAMAD
jgi:hypothetical protein